MVKLFVQGVDLSSPNTTQRDLRSLEDQVNSFIKNPQVLSQSTFLETFESGGNEFMAIILDYNIKQGG